MPTCATSRASSASRRMSEEHQIAVPGLRLALRAHGRADAPPILALHGWLDNAATFDRLAPLLDDFRLWSLDMAGHGLSQHRSADASYDIINTVADLAHVVAALGLPERFVLMGHSLGAAVCSLYAGAFPERVEKLVLLEGLGPLSEPAASAPERLRAALGDEKRSSKTRLFADIDEAAHCVVASIPMSLDSARILLERGLARTDGGGLTWRSDPRLRASSRLRLDEEQVAAFMRAVEAPVFVLRALEGWPIPPEAVALRLGYLSSKHVVPVPGGHHVHLDAPERFASELIAFLR